MSTNLQQQLDEAVARCSAAEISLPSDGMLRNFRTRFLHTDGVGYWVDGVIGEGPLVEQLVRTAEPCTVTFAALGTKVVFKTPILREEQSHPINDGTRVLALLLKRPEEVSTLQRRNAYRVCIFEGAPLRVRAWRVMEDADVHEPAPVNAELEATVVDLSTSGLGTKVKHPLNAHALAVQQRLRVDLQYGNLPALVMAARVMSKFPLQDRLERVGMKFEGLQVRIEGRQVETALLRIVNELSREEARRRRKEE